jgi:hypothetical protein
MFDSASFRSEMDKYLYLSRLARWHGCYANIAPSARIVRNRQAAAHHQELALITCNIARLIYRLATLCTISLEKVSWILSHPFS